MTPSAAQAIPAEKAGRQAIRQEISTLAAAGPLDELEHTHLREALAWLDSGAELCRRIKPATPPMHLVSYFVVSDAIGAQLLLVDHRNAQLWLPPGGHVEPGEHPRETVQREFREELGLDAPHAVEAPLLLTISQTVGLTAGHVDVSLWYWLRLPSAMAVSALDHDRVEFETLRWFALDALPLQRSDPHLGRFAEKLRRHIAAG